MREGQGIPLLAGKRVLLAEDSRAQQRLLSHLLASAGVSVTLAEDGREAVAQVGAEKFDAVLLDMQMPELDGYEAAAQLRRHGYPGLILALTAENLQSDKQRCLEAGCDGYLAKPVQAAELLGLLTRHLAATATTPVPATSGADTSFPELVREYVRGLSLRLLDVQAAAGAEDRETLARLGHKMRGAAAMYGFAELAETAGLLEAAAREGQELTLLRELIDEMTVTIQQIRASQV